MRSGFLILTAAPAWPASCTTRYWRALSRYRQEWIYALRYSLSQNDDEYPGGTDDVEERFAADQEEKHVLRLMTGLPENDRRLIEWLFWDGRTETEVAGGLGISQQAVSKRKHKILKELRTTLGDNKKNEQSDGCS
jgi:RNA polymerase sigma factor (sigma-70 family)